MGCIRGIELARFKKIDFSPCTFELGEAPGTLCLATKSRNLGDALTLTSLPGKLKQVHPNLKIVTYPRGFNPDVFENNPHVSGISWLPEKVYGDDCNSGSGQLIQLKEQWFGLEASPTPRPEIHLSAKEKNWAENYLADKLIPGNEGKPLCVIHPWGGTRSKVATPEYWDRMVSRWNHRFRFWQVGVQGHGAIVGCEYYFLAATGNSQVRRLFALMAKARVFVGVDSGPMHVARAFGVQSAILLEHGEPGKIFRAREQFPYYLQSNWRYSVLYLENVHVAVNPVGPDASASQIDGFLETVARREP